MDLSELRQIKLDGRTKGIPGTEAPFPLAEIGRKGWNVLAEDMPLPLMLLRRSALDHNAAVFGDFLTSRNLSFAPHGKTTMAPQIFAEQIGAGAWGITAATVHQTLVMHHFGVRRVVMANQLIGRANIAAIAAILAADPGFDFTCYVDSLAQFDLIARQLADEPLAAPVNLLIEIGVTGGRTGLRDTADVLPMVQAIRAADPRRLRFRGLAAFESVVPGGAEDDAPIRAFADKVVAAAAALPAYLMEGMEEFVLTGGGSTHFDLIAEAFSTLHLPVPVRVVLRSGCYVTHDSAAYARAQDMARNDPARPWKGELQPAMEVWAYVQSRPEADLALLTMGKRDAPHDAGLPIPFRRWRPGTGWLDCGAATVFSLNDQHAYVRLGPGADWQVGDMIGCGISHPCTAFDKWRFLPVVDDDYAVIDGVMTFF
jgi:D-serine dehydratase